LVFHVHAVPDLRDLIYHDEPAGSSRHWRRSPPSQTVPKALWPRSSRHSSSSHYLQPLDVGCFGPLKQAYGRQIEDLMRAHINHVSKLEFLCAFREAFFTSITEKNIQGSFAGARLVPYDPERVLSKLGVKLRTPTPPTSRPGTAQPWVPQTPQPPGSQLAVNAYQDSHCQPSE
jgi:hypothetical protein